MLMDSILVFFGRHEYMLIYVERLFEGKDAAVHILGEYGDSCPLNFLFVLYSFYTLMTFIEQSFSRVCIREHKVIIDVSSFSEQIYQFYNIILP